MATTAEKMMPKPEIKVNAEKQHITDFTPEIIQQILEKKLSTNLRAVKGGKETETALHFAVSHDKLDWVKALVELDNTLLVKRNEAGRTPLELAEFYLQHEDKGESFLGGTDNPIKAIAYYLHQVTPSDIVNDASTEVVNPILFSNDASGLSPSPNIFTSAPASQPAPSSQPSPQNKPQ